jgi:pimeloyl-ACP methyl ester carboxylesterase
VRRAAVAIVLICLAVGGLGACGGDADRARLSAALEGSRPIGFRTADGVRLAGRLFGPEDATAGVVLAHMLPADQSSWFPFADRLGDQGYLVLTFDFRGYCPGGDAGCSAGTKDPDRAPIDLAAAVRALRERGADAIALVGASMGGTAALVVAAEDPDGIAAVVTLSAPEQLGGLVAGPDVLARVEAATLFLAGTEDATAAASAQAFFEHAGAPKQVELLTTADHGTELLDGNQGERSRDLVLGWLARYLPPAGPGLMGSASG